MDQQKRRKREQEKQKRERLVLSKADSVSMPLMFTMLIPRGHVTFLNKATDGAGRHLSFQVTRHCLCSIVLV
jgi:hypothetical protein